MNLCANHVEVSPFKEFSFFPLDYTPAIEAFPPGCSGSNIARGDSHNESLSYILEAAQNLLVADFGVNRLGGGSTI